MSLAWLNLAVSTATLAGMLAIGIWVGGVNEKLRSHAQQLWEIKHNGMHSSIEGD